MNASTETVKVVRQIPEHVRKDFGGSRAFKRSKRDLLRRVMKEWEDFRLGCAYIPCGSKPVTQIDELLKQIRAAISEKNWGR